MSVSIPVRHGAAIAMIAGAFLFAACDEPEEDVADDVRASQAANETTPITPISLTSPPSMSPSPTPSITIAVTPPPDWKLYENSSMGFSIRYPPDLAVSEEPAASPQGEIGERDVEFRSPEDLRGFLVSTFDLSRPSMTLDEFADEFYCTRDKSPAMLAGSPAIACTLEVYKDFPESVVLTEYSGRFYVITAFGLSEQELQALSESFRVTDRP
jgi:hypothetical protein